jgi:myo-inositol-1(or 4)-monophosphatase
MQPQPDWHQILTSCKENVRKHIQPLLKPPEEPQPSLGTGAGGDPMKLVDLVAEKAIIEILLKNNLNFTLISEESGIKQFGNSPEQFYITVDPVDGTNNFIRGLPFYATSIAVSEEPKLSKIFAGTVTDLNHNITYIAQKGKGAYRNQEKITSSKANNLQEAMIGLDINTVKIKELIPQITELIQKTKHIRHFGANALELCYVADGSTEAFVDLRGKIRTTDVAAAFLIIKEAGGTVTTPEGTPVEAELDPTKRLKFVASGNTKLHKIILNLIQTRKEQKC